MLTAFSNFICNIQIWFLSWVLGLLSSFKSCLVDLFMFFKLYFCGTRFVHILFIGRNVYPRALLTSYNIPVIWCQNLERTNLERTKKKFIRRSLPTFRRSVRLRSGWSYEVRLSFYEILSLWRTSQRFSLRKSLFFERARRISPRLVASSSPQACWLTFCKRSCILYRNPHWRWKRVE